MWKGRRDVRGAKATVELRTLKQVRLEIRSNCIPFSALVGPLPDLDIVKRESTRCCGEIFLLISQEHAHLHGNQCSRVLAAERDCW